MSIKDNERSVVASVLGFFSGNLVSRMTGFFREIVMVTIWGITPSVAAFWMAFRILFFLRRIFGENLLSITLVPYFEKLRKDSPEKTGMFIRKIVHIFSFSTLLTVCFCEAALFLIYKSCSLEQKFTVVLIILLLPSSIFLVLYSLNTVILSCEQTFFLPGIAPAAVNIFWIAIVLSTRRFTCEKALMILSSCLIGGFICQWAITLMPIRKLKKKYPMESFEGYRPFMKLLFPMVLSIVGIAANYLNGVSDMFLSRLIEPSGPAFLWYALRIQQLPLSLLTVGVFAVLLPPISRAVQSKDYEISRRLVLLALKVIVYLLLIVIFGIFLTGRLGIEIIYGHGKFSSTDGLKTFKLLISYSFGLLPVSLISIVNIFFYSKREYTIPVVLGCASVALNIILSYVFGVLIYHDMVVIALVTSVVSWLQVCCLWYCSDLKSSLYKNLLTGMLPGLLRALPALVVAYIITTYSFNFLFPESTIDLSHFWNNLFVFSSKNCIFLVFLYVFAKLFAVNDLLELFQLNFWTRRNSIIDNDT
ncbi:MAG: lipid II flippase MurJ [Victivallaceae bacterium]